MAQYQKIEYRIGKDGKVTEMVLDASGSSCTQTTAGIEQALGRVEAQTLLPEYYTEEAGLESIEPTLQQWRGEDG
jgi:hypothetical protein